MRVPTLSGQLINAGVVSAVFFQQARSRSRGQAQVQTGVAV